MKTHKILMGAVGTLMLMSSCVVYTEHQTTGNPVGTKMGYTKSKVRKDFGGVAAAAKQGKIEKIGTVDIKYYLSGKVAIQVTGE